MNLKLSKALDDYLVSNSHIHSLIQSGIINCAALARDLVPLISARLGNRASESAIHKALTRIAVSSNQKNKSLLKLKLESLSIISGLIIVTFIKNHRSHKLVAKWYEKSRENGYYFNISESSSEITVICSNEIGQYICHSSDSRITQKNISLIQAAFHKKFLVVPGFLVSILRQIANQGINIEEVSSTATELGIYIKSQDVPLAFDTLYYSFIAAD
jgi:hypothetical protein